MAIRNRILLVLASTIGIAALAGCAAQADDTRTAVDGSELAGTWVINDTFESPEQPFIDFADDGTWTASDGCNRVKGTWTLGDGGALTTTAGPSTLMACDGAQLPLAVAQADYVQLNGDALTIYSSSESTKTDLVRSTDPTVGPQGLPVGQWVESTDAGAPFLSLAADGSFSGNDGCNTIFGSWEVADDGAIMFTGVGSTMMACEGVDTWLSTVALGRIQGGVMTVQDADGVVLGQLTAQ